MKATRLPGLARALLTLIGALKALLCVRNKCENFNESAIPSFNLTRWKFKNLVRFSIIMKNAVFTSVEEFQTVLNACLTVHDSESLRSANF